MKARWHGTICHAVLVSLGRRRSQEVGDMACVSKLVQCSGIAIGGGQHVGLRLLDGETASGTPFVGYVNAPAALR
jgi:hypothetical protein